MISCFSVCKGNAFLSVLQNSGFNLFIFKYKVDIVLLILLTFVLSIYRIVSNFSPQFFPLRGF